MKKAKFLVRMIGPQKYKLFLMVIVTSTTVASVLMTPLVFSYVIDNLIHDLTINSAIFEKLTQLLGGKSFLQANLWVVALVLVGLGLLMAISQFLRAKFNADISEQAAFKLRETMFHHISYLPYEELQKQQTGDLIQRSTSDIDQIRRFLSVQISQFVYAVMTIIIAALVLFSIHVAMAWVAVASMPVLFGYGFYFFKQVSKVFKESDEAEAKLSTVIQENLEGIRVVKAFNRELYELDKFEQANQDYRKKTSRLMHLMGEYWASSDAIILFQILAVVLVGIYYAQAGSLSMGDFYVFIAYENMILYPVRHLGRILADLGKVSVATDRLMEIIDIKSEDVDSGKLVNLQGEIVFDQVSFNYPDDQKAVFKDLSFSIEPQTTVAIMGPTGSGKSSLIYLLTRLYDYQGSITIDGVELSEIQKHHLRSNIGLVLQEPFLFSKSIEENIKLAAPKALPNEVERAARIAAIHDVVLGFDQGYQTLVGERGVTLSGGQKQRVAIARALINRQPILIFDDSLSAVDTQTDAFIRQQLAAMDQKQTTIIITHRVQTAQQADKIVVLENGRVSQIGNHQQLMQEPGLYQEIANIQNMVHQEELLYESVS